jgi:hypothetical protein
MQGRSDPPAIAGQTIRARLADLSVAAGATYADGGPLLLTRTIAAACSPPKTSTATPSVHVIAALLGHAGLDTEIYAKLYHDTVFEGYRAVMRGRYGTHSRAEELRDPDRTDWAAFTASSNLRDMSTDICALPTGQHCAWGTSLLAPPACTTEKDCCTDIPAHNRQPYPRSEPRPASRRTRWPTRRSRIRNPAPPRRTDPRADELSHAASDALTSAAG